MLVVWDLGLDLAQAEQAKCSLSTMNKGPCMANEECCGSRDVFDVVIVLFKNSYCLYINMYANMYWRMCVCMHVHLHVQFNPESWQILAFDNVSLQRAPQPS